MLDTCPFFAFCDFYVYARKPGNYTNFQDNHFGYTIVIQLRKLLNPRPKQKPSLGCTLGRHTCENKFSTDLWGLAWPLQLKSCSRPSSINPVQGVSWDLIMRDSCDFKGDICNTNLESLAKNCKFSVWPQIEAQK